MLCSKTPFTLGAARQALKRMPRKGAPTRCYLCSGCGRYHLTSMASEHQTVDAAEEVRGYVAAKGTSARGLSLAEVQLLARKLRGQDPQQINV